MANDRTKPQIDKLRDAARELGRDDDPERFAETARKLAKAKSMPPKPEKPAKAGRGVNNR